MSNDNVAPETNVQPEIPQPVDADGNVILPPANPEVAEPLSETPEPTDTVSNETPSNEKVAE